VAKDLLVLNLFCLEVSANIITDLYGNTAFSDKLVDPFTPFFSEKPFILKVFFVGTPNSPYHTFSQNLILGLHHSTFSYATHATSPVK
jgi:hypothetical protein